MSIRALRPLRDRSHRTRNAVRKWSLRGLVEVCSPRRLPEEQRQGHRPLGEKVEGKWWGTMIGKVRK